MSGLPALVGPPSRRQWDILRSEAEMISKTEFTPERYRGRPDAILACMLAGRELGIGPMSALREITIIDGRPSLSAALITALVRRAGHSISGDSTPREATVLGKRGDTGEELTVTYTWAEAEAVTYTAWEGQGQGRRRTVRKLTDKSNWQSYPADMLWARAVSRLCRRLFSDVLMGSHLLPEGLGATAESDQWVEVGEMTTDDPQQVEREELEADLVIPSGPIRRTPPLHPEEVEPPSGQPPDPNARGPGEGAPPAVAPFLWDRLDQLLEEPPTETWLVRQLETWVREIHALVEGLGIWAPDSLHLALRKREAKHLSDLRKADLLTFARSAYTAAQTAHAERPI